MLNWTCQRQEPDPLWVCRSVTNIHTSNILRCYVIDILFCVYTYIYTWTALLAFGLDCKFAGVEIMFPYKVKRVHQLINVCVCIHVHTPASGLNIQILNWINSQDDSVSKTIVNYYLLDQENAGWRLQTCLKGFSFVNTKVYHQREIVMLLFNHETSVT